MDRDLRGEAALEPPGHIHRRSRRAEDCSYQILRIEIDSEKTVHHRGGCRTFEHGVVSGQVGSESSISGDEQETQANSRGVFNPQRVGSNHPEHHAR